MNTGHRIEFSKLSPHVRMINLVDDGDTINVYTMGGTAFLGNYTSQEADELFDCQLLCLQGKVRCSVCCDPCETVWRDVDRSRVNIFYRWTPFFCADCWKKEKEKCGPSSTAECKAENTKQVK